MPENENDNNGHPAWDNVLNIIPEEFHDQVKTHFQQWDKGVEDRFSEVHSKYDPYKDFVENEVDASQLKMGLGILQAIEQDPKQVYEALAQQFNLSGAPDEQGNTDNVPAEYADLPPAVVKRLQDLERGYETVAGQLNKDLEAKQQAAEDQKLEQTLAGLKAKHGDFHEGFVLAQMLQGAKPDEAVQQWNTLREEITIQARRPQAPKILGGGGVGIPGEQRLDVKKLDPKGTKDLVAQMLAQAAQQSG